MDELKWMQSNPNISIFPASSFPVIDLIFDYLI